MAIDQLKIKGQVYDIGADASNITYTTTKKGVNSSTSLPEILDGINKSINGKSTVSVTQTQKVGNEVGRIDVDGNTTVLYSPIPPIVNSVEANPEGKPTDNLETIKIDKEIYDLAPTAEKVSYKGTNIVAKTVKGALDELDETKASLNALPAVAKSGDYKDLLNPPTLSQVATTGSYEDLTEKPTFANVAITGNYSDLNGAPSLAAVATTGLYNDLGGKPHFAAVAISGSYTDLNSTPNFAAVATTGRYDDLLNLPFIPPDANTNLAPTYSDVQAYIAGDYVVYNGVLYRCKQDIIEPEEWDGSKWVRVYVMNEILALLSNL